MLRIELRTQLLRVRTLIALACLAAVPIVAAIATAPHAGGPNGKQGGLFGTATYSAVNHTMASLAFIAPMLLPIVVALLAAAIGSADRDWGTLRYLYVAPVDRTRLMSGKLGALAITTLVGTLSVLVAGLVSGLAVFGWHPFHITNAANLTAGDAIGRILAASGYTVLCMLSIAVIAFALGLALQRGAEAIAVAIAFVVAASILNAQPSMHRLATLLPMHYWQNWLALFNPHDTADLGPGAVAQVAWVAMSVGAAVVVLLRRDPAA